MRIRTGRRTIRIVRRTVKRSFDMGVFPFPGRSLLQDSPEELSTGPCNFPRVGDNLGWRGGPLRPTMKPPRMVLAGRQTAERSCSSVTEAGVIWPPDPLPRVRRFFVRRGTSPGARPPSLSRSAADRSMGRLGESRNLKRVLHRPALSPISSGS